ncbi:MAG: hypothetical protein ACR2GD_13405 [Pyrinomonadaceae bacterium]
MKKTYLACLSILVLSCAIFAQNPRLTAIDKFMKLTRSIIFSLWTNREKLKR